MAKVTAALAALIALYFINRLVASYIDNFAQRENISVLRASYIRKTCSAVLFILAIVSSCFLLGFAYQQVFIFLSSVLAVAGIALIAQWSMLSHITAGFIIFFAFPYRIGDQVKVVDKDEDIVGTIVEIALFHVLIRRADNSLVTYPNSLILQKAVIKFAGQPKLSVSSDNSSKSAADAGGAPSASERGSEEPG